MLGKHDILNICAVFLLSAINQGLNIFTLSIFRYNGRNKPQLSLYDVHQKPCGATIAVHSRMNGYQTKMSFEAQTIAGLIYLPLESFINVASFITNHLEQVQAD